MHRALYIKEVLCHIFALCSTETYPIRPPINGVPDHWQSNQHVAKLARTCRAFKEPALDMLWAKLDNLSPLAWCLPGTARQWIESQSEYYLPLEHLEQIDWNIVLGYTRRVRALPFLHRAGGLSEKCIEALSNSPTSVGSLFPNLRVVGFHTPGTVIAPLLRHLINPNLTNVHFRHSETLGGALEKVLGEMCSTVTDFHVLQRSHSDTISSLVCLWQNLCSVECVDVALNVNALSHLSRSRHLIKMSMQVHDALIDQILAVQPCASTPTLFFSTLRQVRLGSPGSLDLISKFLGHVRVPVVWDLFVTFQTRPTARDLASFFLAIQEACSHVSLYYISVSHVGGPAGRPLENAYYINFDRLRPLTVFVNMKFIILNVSSGLDLNEHELLCLASSWPNLEWFEVGSDFDCSVSCAITPRGFLQLLERCRSLRILYFTFDTRGYSEIPQGHPWRGLTISKLTRVHLLHSLIEEESINALGFFFHVAPFPKFMLDMHWNGYGFRGRRWPDDLARLRIALETRSSRCQS